MIYDLRFKNKVTKPDGLLKVLLKNRGIATKREIDNFLDPKLQDVTPKSVGIDQNNLKKAVGRIKRAIERKEQIVVFGDYDVDGICGTAILWETLNSLGAKVSPYIPHRIEEGYGLSIKGIQNVILNLFQDPKSQKTEMLKQVQHDTKKKLIITVDNGIVANKAVDFAGKQGIDVIVTDHHVPSKSLPKAFAIVHTTSLCGTGVAYLLAKEVLSSMYQVVSIKKKILNTKYIIHDTFLELVALATVADLVPLKGANRTLLKFGLEALRKTKRVGLLELFKEAGLQKDTIGVYEIGHMIAPRLNATGRLEYAMDSLRLICTNNQKRAETLSKEIGLTNKERQLLTVETTKHAIEIIKNKKELEKLLIVVHESYQQGVIGLVAGKLVEEFYRPAIVISKGEKFSKASARSVRGFNVIEFIRTAQEFLVDAGGHPMAAGFTIETAKIPVLEKALRSKIGSLLDGDILKRKLRIDCEIPLYLIDSDFYDSLQKLSPFGMGNPEPTFLSKDVVIEDIRLVGMDGKHIKLRLACHPEQSEGSRDSSSRSVGTQNDNRIFEGIWFSAGEKAKDLHIGDKANIAYMIAQDEWNGEKRLQLKLKDLKKL